MACKRDIKTSLIDKVAQLSATKSAGEINAMFGTEVLKPSGRIFIPESLVDKYWSVYNTSKVSFSPAPTSDLSVEKTKLAKQTQFEVNSLYQERARLFEKVNRTSIEEGDAKIKLLQRIEDINSRIEQLKSKNELYENITLDTLQRGAEYDFDRLNVLLSYEGDDLDVTLRNIEEAQRIVNFYRDAGDFSGSNFLFDNIEDLSDEEKDFWQRLRDRADGYQKEITEQHREVIKKYTKRLPNVKAWLEANDLADIDYEFLTKPVKDKDWLSLQGLALSDSLFGEQVLVLDVLEYLIKKYEDLGIKQRRDIITKIDDLLEKISGKHNKFDEFKQLDADGNFTGRIIYRYSQKFYDERSATKQKYANEIALLSKNTDAASIEEVRKIQKKLHKWQLENEILIDYRYLPEIAIEFPELASEFLGDDYDKNQYRDKIISHLGQKGYDTLIESAKKNIKEYKLLEDYYREMGEDNLAELIDNLGVTPGVRIDNVDEAMDLWKALHSPFHAAKVHYSAETVKIVLGGKQYIPSDASQIKGRYYAYIEEIPRRNVGRVLKRDNLHVVVDTNKLTGYYDERFKTIEQDEDLYNFWSFAIHNLDLARAMMPFKYQNQFKINSIMFMEKTVMEQLTDKGALGLAYSSAYDAVVKSLTDRELSTESYDENPFSPNQRTVNYAFLGERKILEDKLYEAKLLEFFIQEGIQATPQSINDYEVRSKLTPEQKKKYREAAIRLRKEAIKEIAEKASFDLGSVLKFQLGTMIALNQRENILPVLNAYEKTIKEIKKVKTNRAGEKMSREGRIMSTDLPVENIIKSALYKLDVFTGQPVQDIEAPSDKKMYTQDEKIEMKRLEKLKERATEEQKTAIDSLIDTYGRQISGSGTIDTALAYLRLRGLGWNVSAQIPNAVAGYFANFAVAADGRVVKMSALRRAYNLFWHIAMPSFLRGSAKTEEIKKIKTLMYKGDFLLDATSEMQKSRFSSEKGLKGKEEWLSPYMPTRITEYMNQGALVVSRLMSIPVIDNSGQTKNLWDALDENLNIKPEFSEIAKDWDWNTGELMNKETVKLRHLIENTHGDYSETGRQYAKRKIAGRLALFFKTWLPNAVKSRFGAYKSSNVYYDLPVKGRYRSHTPATLGITGATLGTWFAPGIGCVCAGTKVYTKNGQIKNIEELVKEDGIIGWSGNKAVPENIINFQDTAIKPCVEIITKRGHSIKCSTDHPIVWSTSDNYGEVGKAERGDKRVRFKKWEWKEAGNIRIGEQIAVIKEIPLFGNKSMWEPRLVGMLIGDGNYSNKRVPRYWSLDQELQQYVESKGGVCDEIRISSENKEFKGYSIKGIFNNLKELGIKGQTGVSKTLPFNFWMYDKESISELIGGLYDTDGCVNVSKNRITIKISQVSENIITSLRDILIRFGIHGSITKTKPITRMYKNRIIATKEHFVLNIKDKESLLTFHKNFKFLIKYKQDKLNLIPEFYKNRKSKYNSSSGVIFDSVAQINDIGHQTIYNLEVDNSHTYIANNIVTHNTAIGYGIGFGVAKIWGNDVNESIATDFKDSLSAMGALLKRLVYSKMSLVNPALADKLDTQFNGKFDELDAANLRANLQEIQNMLTLLLVYFIAKATLYDDDEDKKNQIVHNYMINQIVKMQQDLALFTSPESPGKLIEQAIPISRLVTQSFGLITSANKAIFQMEMKPNEDSFGENLSEWLPRPFPSTRKLERTYGEPKMLKQMMEEN